MKWFTHKTLAITSALVLDAPTIGIVTTFIGSILPDLTERTLAMGNMHVWGKIHRQAAHWFGWYILLILLGIPIFDVTNFDFIQKTPFLPEAITWLGFGGLTHICLDALTPRGIPLWPSGGKQRLGFPLIKTGSLAELFFFISILTILIYQLDLSSNSLTHLIKKIKTFL